MATIRHRIEIAAPAGRIWPLVSTAEGLTRWWAADVVVKPGRATVVELGFFGRSTVYRLRAVEAAPPESVRWRCETGKEWAGTSIAFDLAAASGGTTLRFSHAGWRRATDYFVSCNTTWGALMFRLKAAAEGKATSPLFSRTGMAGGEG